MFSYACLIHDLTVVSICIANSIKCIAYCMQSQIILTDQQVLISGGGNYSGLPHCWLGKLAVANIYVTGPAKINHVGAKNHLLFSSLLCHNLQSISTN